ncbi:MAG: iron-containing alcohol dehydrogenase [Planctomycetota bacterium]
MNNFIYCNPTRIIFGRGAIAELKNLVPPCKKIMLIYGGGSIKRNGVYQQVRAALKDWPICECGGIEPNPKYEQLMQFAAAAKEQGIEYLLAIGGGSVIDGTKFIAAALRFEGSDPWDMIAHQSPVKTAMPFGCVLTIPASGSEMNHIAVISRTNTRQKIAFRSECLYPQFSILDPAVTLSLPKKQVRNGVVDAFVHVLEQYLTYPVNSPLQDRQAEAICLTLLEEGPKTLKNLDDYDARANFMWCATQALNGLIGCGVPTDFACHQIGHELNVLYGLVHAESLAAILPGLLRHSPRKAAKLAQFARRVCNISGNDQDALIEAGIQKIEEFFHALGMPTGLLGFQLHAVEVAPKVREALSRRNARLGEHKNLTPEKVAEILERCST